MRALPGIRAVESSHDELRIEVEEARRDTPTLVRAIAAANVDVLGVVAAAATLESVYFDVMGARPPTDGAPI